MLEEVSDDPRLFEASMVMFSETVGALRDRLGRVELANGKGSGLDSNKFHLSGQARIAGKVIYIQGQHVTI